MINDQQINYELMVYVMCELKNWSKYNKIDLYMFIQC
jgi:hypothetical protein